MLYSKVKELPALLKRITALIISFSLILSTAVVCRAEDSPSTAAQAAALYCVDTDEFLYLKNPDERLPMASTTKIMTALLTLEAASKSDKIVTFNKAMIAEGSSMGIKLGYKLRLSDLAAGMMTVSGNDAANAAAIAISGSYEKFARRMNGKAKAIGMNNTNFVTPSGLDDENHYSCARDMALLMSFAMKNKAFSNLSGKKNVRVDYVFPADLSVTYSNHNRLLSLYRYCTGGKTGYTKRAGRCLVTSAERDGKHLIAVTINSGDDWNDHIKLFDYGFACLSSVSFDDTPYSRRVPVAGSRKESVDVGVMSSKSCIVKKEDSDKVKREILLPQFVYAPIKRGDTLGRIVYKLNGEEIACNELIALDDCGYAEREKSLFEIIGEAFKKIFGF